MCELSFKKFKEEALKDKEFVAEYESLRPEFENIRNIMIEEEEEYEEYKNKIHYIKDPKVFLAVSFVRSMMREDEPIGLAIYKAAKYYRVQMSKVSREIGKHAANCKYKKNN